MKFTFCNLNKGYHIIYMCPDIIFQIFPPCSMPMTSHDVTVVSHASLLSRIKRKEKKSKIDMKSEK